MSEEYGMKVWLELAVKNARDMERNIQKKIDKVKVGNIFKSSQDQLDKYLKSIDGKNGIVEGLKSQIESANKAIEKAKTMPELKSAMATKGQAQKNLDQVMTAAKGKSSVSKIATTAGAILGVLFVIKKINDKMYNQMAKSSPYLQGILNVFKRAWSNVWRPFGDFLGNLLRPLAVALLRLSVKWLEKTRDKKGKLAVKAGVGGLIGSGPGAAIGSVIGGVAGSAAGGIGAIPGAIVGGLAGGAIGAGLGAAVAVLKDAGQGAKNLAIVGKAWTDKLLNDVFNIDMDKVAQKVGMFFTMTLPNFFNKTLPEWFSNQVKKLGDFASYIWDKLTSGVSNLKDKISQFAGHVWDKITTGVSNVYDRLRGWAQWVWGKITDSLSTVYSTLSGWAQWLWTKITDGVSNVYDKISGFAEYMWNEITDAISNIGSWLGNLGYTIWNSITEAVKNAMTGFSGGWKFWWNRDTEGHQKGLNYVPQTGMYKLHRGEKVVNASRTSREGSGNIVINPTFNINATGGVNSSIESDLRRASRMLVFDVRRQNYL